MVVKGDGVAGPDYSTPTANLEIGNIDLDHGIYAVIVDYNEKQYNGALCYGADGENKFEVHLLDFQGNLFGEELQVTILSKVSEIIPWVSLERMRAKVLDDIQQIRAYFEKLNS